MKFPERGSFHHMVYIDFVCAMKCGQRKKIVASQIMAARQMTRRQVMYIYDKYIKPQFRAGVHKSELV
ncbi:hypothetical protein [Mesorhizobium wenxiniae]|uniref:Uncharacterized protein n=1 Tax=Mesorhizobium wenxiniae TaxID=2014805 RepID=A0A271KE05_9HYPH|nr:hypothetical protein [Mesorhizobium wenxiniae]PAP94001.1 hypothetical protein CIT31_16675 [Mesorhizobium wenxiniae]